MARRELGPASLALVQAVRAALTTVDETLLTACSGGPDSLALAWVARHVAARDGRGHAAAVVDHGLQAGSDAVARTAVERLQAIGYDDVELLRVAVGLGEGTGLEAAAREVRYEALREAARSRGATVLLGHTLDDQAETVLLGLARGSGTRSLAGMAPRTGYLLRPLLGVRRDVTRQACAELGLPTWADPHNEDLRFARVRVRQRVLPSLEDELGPGIAQALARTAELARDDADLLDRLAAEADPGTDDLAVALLAELPRPLRRRLLRRWLARHGALDHGLRHVAAVEGLVTDWHGQGPIQLPGLEVVRLDGRLHLRRPGHH